MYETLVRPQEVNQIPALESIADVSEKLKKAEQKREEKRLRQIANSRLNQKRKRNESGEGDTVDVGEEAGIKRTRTDEEDDTSAQPKLEQSRLTVDHQMSDGTSEQFGTSSTIVEEPGAAADAQSATKINVSKTMPEVRGHTSYLTFACLAPVSAFDLKKDFTPGTEVLEE